MKKFDLISGLIWFILGIIICIESIKLNLGNFHNPGPGFLPFVSGATLGLFGSILTFSTILKRSGKEGELNGKVICVKRNWKTFFLILLTLFAYSFLLEYLGFAVTTFIFLSILFKLKEPKRSVMPFVFSAVATILSVLIFVVWLKCQFPGGIFGY